jgi:hypothetical protein
MPEADNAPEKRGKTWRERLLTVPGIVAGTALTAVVSWFVTQLVGGLNTRIEAREPLSIVVRDNPATIGGFSDQPIYGVIKADVTTTGSPGPGCTGFRDWLKLNGGVDAGETKLQITVQGRLEKPVLISEMRVKVLSKLPLITGIAVSCLPAAEANYRGIEIDLDNAPPRVKYQLGKKTFGFTVQSSEIETFNVVAKAANGHYVWVIELDVMADGKQRTLEISGPGGSFETTARQWTDNWEWDYQGSWSASLDPVRGSRPQNIPVGRPLPVLN